MFEQFILDGKTPVLEPDHTKASRWMIENRDKLVIARTNLLDAYVSTVFLGLNHNLGPGPPLLFETLVIDGPHDGYRRRCSTWAQAEAQHRAACALGSERVN
jgi:hypothetical protein